MMGPVARPVRWETARKDPRADSGDVVSPDAVSHHHQGSAFGALWLFVPSNGGDRLDLVPSVDRPCLGDSAPTQLALLRRLGSDAYPIAVLHQVLCHA